MTSPNGAPRRARRTGLERRGGTIEQRPWGQLRNPYPPMTFIAEDAVERIHEGSIRILEETGIRFPLAEARAILGKGGAIVDESTFKVRIGRDLVDAAVASSPEVIAFEAPNPARNVAIGRDLLVYTTVLGPPYCTDLVRGRRPGTLADYGDFMRLAQFFNAVHLIGGSPVEPQDVPVPIRHLDAMQVMLTLSDKVPYVFAQSRRRIEDALTMIAIARGVTLEELGQAPSSYCIINTNSPLQYDLPMATGVIDLARHGQVTLITPFAIGGAAMPITHAGTLALQNAEFLAGLVLAQLARPGAPVVYGGSATNVDMRTGSPAYGSPDFVKFAGVSGQLARRYRVPFRGSCMTGSNVPDAQAAWEAQLSLTATVFSGCNLVMHAAGWLEGGLCSSFEKFAMDVELMQGMAAILDPVRVDDDTLALDEIAAVAPGGHFFDAPRTMARYETEYYRPLLAETRNYGLWLESGGKDATARAHDLYLAALREYQPPPLAADRREALDAFVARRKEEGGAEIT